MIKSMLVAVALLAASGSAAAQRVNIPSPYAPGGSITPMVDIVADGLSKRGWTVDLKTIGSCGPVKETFEKSNETVVTVWATNWQSKGNTCLVPVTPENFVDILQQNSLYFCGRKGEMDFKLVPGKTYTVAVNTYNNPSEIKNIEAVAKKAGATLKFVTYKNSGAIRTAYEANEIDAIYSSIGLAEHSKGNTKCLFTNADTAVDGIPNIASMVSTTGKGETFVSYVLTNGKGLTAGQTAKLKADIREILNSKEINDYLKSRYIQRLSDSPEKQLKFIEERLN